MRQKQHSSDDQTTMMSSTMTDGQPKTKQKTQMVSVCDLFYFADTVDIKICIVASCCFALITGAVYPGKGKWDKLIYTR
jgi:hypothetical protein